MSDREALPDPAREALDEPHLDAEELEREIGDSEAWDEASDERMTFGCYRRVMNPYLVERNRSNTVTNGLPGSRRDYVRGLSQVPDSAERKTASITAMFLIASVERNRHRSAFPHGSGKDVALNRVLVAGRKSFYRDAAAQTDPARRR